MGISVVQMLVMELGDIPVQDSRDAAVHLHPARGRIGWLKMDREGIAEGWDLGDGI